MGNNITDRLKYKESIVKFSRKYGEISEIVKASFDNVHCNKSYIWS